jgi:hypothetical protein
MPGRSEASTWQQPVDDEDDLTAVPGTTGHDATPELSDRERTEVLVGNHPIEFSFGCAFEPLLGECTDVMKVGDERSLAKVCK